MIEKLEHTKAINTSDWKLTVGLTSCRILCSTEGKNFWSTYFNENIMQSSVVKFQFNV